MELLLFSSIASVMVIGIVLILYLFERIKNYAGLFLVYFLLGMMISMFLSAIYYLYYPSSISIAIAFLTNSIYMVSLLVPFFLNAKRLASKEYNGGHEIYVSTLAVVNEFLMGYAFNLAYLGKNYFENGIDIFNYSIDSYWFFYPMMAEMLSLYIINYMKNESVRRDLFPLIGIATFPPILLNETYWIYSTVIISLGLCFIGVISSKDKTIKIVYLALAIGTVLTFYTSLLYEVLILVGMVMYYQKVLLKKSYNAFNA
ncbi:hypothetical protein [Stygiolobus caldivivus]|uniref:Uncharacterized protein n=1 Tax=Stygiolobus caldivivus TaxID=2824673 RepID=A0A8D5U783_9CREN|nr:hypothetical protein [Stygiolobus caldivivus]BCU70340.1 hypothetical protein KN1_16370 [Stygiolobus caldivivus]